MVIVCISDTHEYLPKLPGGDILVHAGDATYSGQFSKLAEFAHWFESQPHKHKIFVPGNHDLSLDRKHPRFDPACVTLFKDRAFHYADNDYFKCTIEGLNFFGGPWVPNLDSWAFREKDMRNPWRIPRDTDVLVTHGPVYNVRDGIPEVSDPWGLQMEHIGSKKLRAAIPKSLQVHIHGHIHEAYGISINDSIKTVCASIMNRNYKPVNSPIVIDVNPRH